VGGCRRLEDSERARVERDRERARERERERESGVEICLRLGFFCFGI